MLFQTAFLGDLLLSIPLIKNIKAAYPGCELHLVCRKPFGSFFKDLSLVDHLTEVDKKNKDSLKELKHELGAKEYDLLICPHESFRSAYLCSKVKAKEKIGFRRWFSRFFFTKLVTRPDDLPDVLRQTSLLVPLDKEFGVKWVEFVSKYRGAGFQSLGVEEGRMLVPEFLSMSVGIDKKISLPGECEGLELSSCIAIAPGSVWPTKRWRQEHFIEFCNSKSEKVFILGSPGEAELCEEVSKKIPGSINLAGKTKLSELFYLLTKVKYLICNDSGTMHMGTAASCDIISIFGPTTLDIGYRPWSNNAYVAQADLKCRPCGLHGHKKCPIGTHECMKSVKASQLDSILPQFDSKP